MILQELKNGNYVFRFDSDKQWPKYVEFGVNQLRLHRTWFNGYWISPLEASELAVEVYKLYLLISCLSFLGS